MTLFIGLLMVYAAFWVGPLGVLDLYEYAENAEHLWLDLRWDMHRTPPDSPYSRFSIGLPILSGPFVYAGELVQWLSGGAVGRRWVMATISPLAMAAACLLLERIALMLGHAPSMARWSAIILGVSGAALFYTRFFFVEPVVGLFALGSIAALLQAEAGRSRPAWLFACGVSAGLALMCHYADLFLVAGLGLVYAYATMRRSSGSQRWRDLMQLAAGPIAIGALIMGMNWHNFGNPLRTGYSNFEENAQFFGFMRLWRNLKALGLITAGAPWLVACLILAWRGRAVPGPWKWCASALLLAVALQQLFWLTFKYYSWSPLRYEMPLLMVAAVGLPALACAVSQRWPRRGMVYVTLVLMLAGVASFLGGNHDFHPPLVNDQEDPMYPGQVTIGTWYARRAPFHLGRDYMLHADGIEVGFVYPLTPVGPAQLTILSTLLTLAALLIRRSYALAAGRSIPNPGRPAEPTAAT
jgi:4-amino-4-deoxy-L-arabinose transferase-like glycosyltransferase